MVKAEYQENLSCLQMGLRQSLLECGRKPSVNTLNNKRTTRTGGNTSVSSPDTSRCTYARLNRRAPNGTLGGVRGRG